MEEKTLLFLSQAPRGQSYDFGQDYLGVMRITPLLKILIKEAARVAIEQNERIGATNLTIQAHDVQMYNAHGEWARQYSEVMTETNEDAIYLLEPSDSVLNNDEPDGLTHMAHYLRFYPGDFVPGHCSFAVISEKSDVNGITTYQSGGDCIPVREVLS
ncbi:MAG: hypothetical protein DRP52_02630 [Planctomycetota bacterium]|nr:MAG: hypothetical protein DRP52_02630 [Planctomycetota bacterium]